MDNTENTNASEWVRDRLASLAPPSAWEPNADRGLEHFRGRERRANRRRELGRGAALAFLIACIVWLALPATRGIAQRLWDRFYTKSLEAIRLNGPRGDLKGLPQAEFVIPVTGPHRVQSIAQAHQEAGFEPRLPKPLMEQIALGSALLAVNGPIVVRMRINVADLRTALQRRGIDLVNVNVPQSWDGMEILGQTSPSIYAGFKGVTIMQTLPNALVTPAGFALGDFAEIALRIAGLSAPEAHGLRDKFAESGGLFALIPTDAKYSFQEVSLISGQGLLFQNDTDEDDRRKCPFCPGSHELVLTWTTPDRVFQLRSQNLTVTVDQVVEIANSWDNRR